MPELQGRAFMAKDKLSVVDWGGGGCLGVTDQLDCGVGWYLLMVRSRDG